MGIEQYVLEKREIVNEELFRILSKKGLLTKAARHTILSPSHRWRPIVTIATADMYGILNEEILPIACAVEIIHGSSIIIDDLPSFDDGMLRRGKPTLHRVYGEHLAVCTAYSILVMAYSSISSKNGLSEEIRRRLLDYFYSTLGEMIEGQSKDIASKNNDMTVDKILEMYEQKSGALYGFSAVAGGLVGKASDAELDFLSKYGRRMGTAYQILDDILDIEAQPIEIGKDVRKDLGKAALPSFIEVDASRIKAQELINDSKEALTHIGKETHKLSDLVDYIVLVNVNRKETSPIIKYN